MSSLRNIVWGCVSDRSQEAADVFSPSGNSKRPTNDPYEYQSSDRVKFGVGLADALRDDNLPDALVEILVYLARDGVTTTDLFRRPGNSTDLKVIMKRLSEGRDIQLTNYNFYTLASVVKKFLLKIPGGVFGPDVENRLLHVLEFDDRLQQYELIHSVISSLPPAVQKLTALLFGTWFRIVNHSEYNSMSSESVAKSVAGSLFHTCADDPVKVNRAVQILQILIDDFGVGKMFGRKNIQYFAETTRTGINICEKYRYELSLPMEKSMAEFAAFFPLFIQVVDHDVICHDMIPAAHAITEEEFYSSKEHPQLSSSKPSPKSSTVDVVIRHSAASSPPSPHSLQTSVTYMQQDPDYNPHKKLTHVSSLSAPEVNQGCISPSDDILVTTSPCPGLSTSLCRFDSVRRRQLLRLRKRSNWFLSPPNDTSQDSRSALSSFEASGISSSMDPASSSEAATSDGAMSDGIRVSSDFDCPFEESSASCRATDPVLRRIQSKQRRRMEETEREDDQQTVTAPTTTVLPSSSTAEQQTGCEGLLTVSSPTNKPSLPTYGGEEVLRIRYFMVESYYGIPTTTAPDSSAVATTTGAFIGTVPESGT